MKKKLLLLLMFPLVGYSQILSEDFEAGIPETWSQTIINGEGEWVGADQAFDDGEGGALIFNSNVALFDDDALGEDAEPSTVALVSPVIDLSSYSDVSLSFDFGNYTYIVETNFTVEVYNGTSWVSVFEASGDQYDEEFQPINTVVDLANFTNADFQVRFVYDDAADWSFGAAVDNVVVSGTLGLKNLSDSNFSVYPNPVKGNFQVQLGSQFNTENVNVTVTDMVGKTVGTYANSASYNVSSLASGVYTVTITDGKTTANKKVVIQ